MADSLIDSGIQVLKSSFRGVSTIHKWIQNAYIRGLSQEGRVPVIVYQMGKVGSSSIRTSLREAGVYPVYHAHRINPEYIREVEENRKKRGLEPLTRSDVVGNKIRESIVEKKEKI